MTTEIHPVDEILPTPRLLALGLQHVLVMYAGAVAVPLIIGRALKLPPEDVAFLISADLFACGLATLVQCPPASDDGRHLCFVFGILAALCVRSRWVTVAGGGIMLLLGLIRRWRRWSKLSRSRCLAAPAW